MRFLNRRRSAPQKSVELNVIPLIDVVFFLLVFYVISSSFLSESAIHVQRPQSTTARALSAPQVAVVLARSGEILVEGRLVALPEVQRAVAAALRGRLVPHALVIPDRNVPTGMLIQVMDACTAAGATQVSVAAQRDPG